MVIGRLPRTNSATRGARKKSPRAGSVRFNMLPASRPAAGQTDAIRPDPALTDGWARRLTDVMDGSGLFPIQRIGNAVFNDSHARSDDEGPDHGRRDVPAHRARSGRGLDAEGG